MRRDAFCGFCGRTNIYIHLKFRERETESVIEGESYTLSKRDRLHRFIETPKT